MSTTPPTPAGPPDDLDRLLGDFFKAQLRHPWPNAPVPPAAAAEPSERVRVRPRAAETPAPARRDAAARARFTLAASVALMLGALWYFVSVGVCPHI